LGVAKRLRPLIKEVCKLPCCPFHAVRPVVESQETVLESPSKGETGGAGEVALGKWLTS
jgi:hypothetical protein